MSGKILNYSCTNFKFMVGDLDVTKCVNSFGVAQSKFDVGKALIWSGSIGLSSPMPPYGIGESLDNFDNPDRWARGRHPVKVFLFGAQILTLRIKSYFYDPDTRESEAQLTDLLGLIDFSHDPKDTELITTSEIDKTGKVAQSTVTWKQVITNNLVRGSRLKSQEYVRADQIHFPANSGDYHYAVPPQISQNPVDQIAQIAVACGGWTPWVDANENIRFCKFPLNYVSPCYSITREEVEEFKRQDGEEDEISQFLITASNTSSVEPKERTLDDENSAGEGKAIFSEPKFPQITEVYGGTKQGDSYALLTRKTIKQPTQSGSVIYRETKTEARVDVVFPDIDSSELNADMFFTAEEEKVTETYDEIEGRLQQKETIKYEPLGKIAADDYPYSTARVLSERTTEDWTYESNIPIKKETITHKTEVAVAGSYADFVAGQGLGLVPAEKSVEEWKLQTSSATENTYVHITQNFKTRGELFPEYVSEWENWTVGLGLVLSPDSPEPEIVSVSKEPTYKPPEQPIKESTSTAETETTHPGGTLVNLPDLSLVSGADVAESFPSDNSFPDPGITYSTNSPTWTPLLFNNWDIRQEISLSDAPDNADLETVCQTAMAVARARLIPYNITQPIRKVDVEAYQPLRTVEIDDWVFVRDGFSIALGENGGAMAVAVAYTGLTIGRKQSGNVARPWQQINSFESAVIIAGEILFVNPSRASAESISLTLVTGTATIVVPADYSYICTTSGQSKAVKWLGANTSATYAVTIASGANLLGQSTIYAIGWTQTPNTSFTGAQEIANFSGNSSFFWDRSTYKWVSFVVKTLSTNGQLYRRGLFFTVQGTAFVVNGR